MFNKITLCIEESVHVLFDESNSLSENDAQEEEFELGLVRKEVLLQDRQGKNTMEKTTPEGVPQNDRQGENQTGGNTVEPCSGQHQSGSSGTGSGTDCEPDSPSVPVRVEHVSVDPLTPRPWKHQRSHPLEQIFSDINTGVQTRSKIKNFCAFYAFLSNIEPKNVIEALADSDWVTAMQEELHQFERNKVWHLVP